MHVSSLKKRWTLKVSKTDHLNSVLNPGLNLVPTTLKDASALWCLSLHLEKRGGREEERGRETIYSLLLKTINFGNTGLRTVDKA